jgi:hypothetical protein
MIEASSDIAVFVSSCDAYQDLWAPYFTFFFRYWPDCPFPIYLVANNSRYPDPRIQTILLGEDEGWATNTRHALEQLDYPYIFYTHEDFFPDRRVSTSRILRLLAYMKQRNAGYLRLYPSPGPDAVCADNQDVGEIHKGSEYRTSLQAAIWKREIMLALLKDGENAWEMEINGSIRSNKLDVPFLSAVRDPITNKVVDPPLSYFCTAVYKGRWMRRAVRFCAQEGVPIDLASRPVETFWRENWRRISGYAHWLIAPLSGVRRHYRESREINNLKKNRDSVL